MFIKFLFVPKNCEIRHLRKKNQITFEDDISFEKLPFLVACIFRRSGGLSRLNLCREHTSICYQNFLKYVISLNIQITLFTKSVSTLSFSQEDIK